MGDDDNKIAVRIEEDQLLDVEPHRILNQVTNDYMRKRDSAFDAAVNDSRGLFQQQPGNFGASVAQATSQASSIAPLMHSPNQVIQDALDSHRAELDRLSKTIDRLRDENECLKAEQERQGKILDKLLNMFRNPTKRKRGTV